MIKNLVTMWLVILLFAVVSGRPQQHSDYYDPILPGSSSVQTTTPPAIIAQYDVNSPDGSFNNSYETSNGIKVINTGHFKRVKIPRYEDVNGKVYEEHEEDILVQTGSYSYFDPEGNVITLTYLADENGFQPSGSHIPTVPPTTTNLTNQQYIQDQQIQQTNPNYQDRPIDQRFGQSRPNQQQQRPGSVQDRPIQG